MYGLGKIKDKSPWAKLKKGEAKKLNKIASTGLFKGKEKTLRLPK